MYQMSIAATYQYSDTDNVGGNLAKLFRTGFSTREEAQENGEDSNLNTVTLRMKWEDYLQIYTFVHQHEISQRGADSLLSMMRDMHGRHNVRVPLPLNFKTILRCVEKKGDILKGYVTNFF